jgi:hypothetical protein
MAGGGGGGLDSVDEPKLKEEEKPKEVESYAASGIDNALDLLEVVTAKVDKASIGAQASKIEQHPEVIVTNIRIFFLGSDISIILYKQRRFKVRPCSLNGCGIFFSFSVIGRFRRIPGTGTS